MYFAFSYPKTLVIPLSMIIELDDIQLIIRLVSIKKMRCPKKKEYNRSYM